MGDKLREVFRPDRDKMAQTVIISAVEGGTGYWASVSDYDHQYDGDPAKATATLHEMLPDESGYEEKGMVLNRKAVEAGLALIKAGEVTMNETLLKEILMFDLTGDSSGFDADCADVIAQVGLLGEIRYG